VPGWLMPIEGMGFWSGLWRILMYATSEAALLHWLGWWGVLATPLLIPVGWLVEAIVLGSRRLLALPGADQQRP